MKHLQVIFMGLVILMLSACAMTQPNPQPNPDPQPGKAEAGFVIGQVSDAAGKPLAGVQVFADNTLFYDTNAIGITDEKGFYRIDVREPLGTWHMSAQYQVNYHGQDFRFALEPDNDAAFPGSEGATRNFTWHLTGETPQGLYYGGLVWVYADYNDYSTLPSLVELTFSPAGPLVDGSAGNSLVHLGDHWEDVPVGRYLVSARYLPEDGVAQPLLVSIRNTNDYHETITADFKQDSILGQVLELQVLNPNAN